MTCSKGSIDRNFGVKCVMSVKWLALRFSDQKAYISLWDVSRSSGPGTLSSVPVACAMSVFSLKFCLA